LNLSTKGRIMKFGIGVLLPKEEVVKYLNHGWTAVNPVCSLNVESRSQGRGELKSRGNMTTSRH